MSASQLAMLRKSYVGQLGSEMERQREIMASAAYKAGDPETVAARYRIHFRHGLHQAADYDKLMARMSARLMLAGSSAGLLVSTASELPTRLKPAGRPLPVSVQTRLATCSAEP